MNKILFLAFILFVSVIPLQSFGEEEGCGEEGGWEAGLPLYRREGVWKDSPSEDRLHPVP